MRYYAPLVLQLRIPRPHKWCIKMNEGMLAEREGFYLPQISQIIDFLRHRLKYALIQAILCFPPCLLFPPCLPSRTNFRILWTGWTGSPQPASRQSRYRNPHTDLANNNSITASYGGIRIMQDEKQKHTLVMAIGAASTIIIYLPRCRRIRAWSCLSRLAAKS